MRRRPVVLVLVLVVGAALAAYAWWPRGGTPPTVARPAAPSATPALHGFAQPAVQGRRVAGIVLRDGVGAAGAAVLLVDPLGRTTRRATGSDGRFDFGPQVAAAFTVVAELPLRAPAIEAVDLRDPRVAADDLHLVLHPCDASLRGTIRDATGGVIPHARIALPVRTGMTTGSEADDAGAYALCVPMGSTHVVLAADGYARSVEAIEVLGPVQRDFTLVPAATVDGHVLRARDRAPVANAVVELWPDEASGVIATRAVAVRTLTDDTGAFHFEGVLPGRYQVLARGEGLASRRSAYVLAETGESTDVECLVDATFTVSGKLLEEGTRTPLAGLRVVLTGSVRLLDASAVSQPDGTFAIDVLPGTYDPGIGRRTLRDPAPVIVEAAPVQITLVVARGSAVAGRVTRAGEPVDDVEVSLRGPATATVTTDHAGRYAAEGLPPGAYQVYAESARVGAFSPGPKITLADGERRTGVDLELDLAGAISGIVVDQHDKPVSGVLVAFSLLGGADFGNATTGSDGTFRARAMSGGGEYVYEVRVSARTDVRLPPLRGKRFPPVVLRDGASEVTGLRIQVRREDLALGGRVLDETGKPVLGARVAIERSYHTDQPLVTDEHGAFLATGLQPGPYGVIAAHAGREARIPTATAGRRDLVLQFAPTGAIEGTFEGFGDEPEVRIWGSRAHAPVSITRAGFRVDRIAPGKYHISAETDAGGAHAAVEVTAGAVAKVALRASGFGVIAGSVLDETTRAPVADVFCVALPLDEAVLRGSDGTSDARGRLRIVRAQAGRVEVRCGDSTAETTVTAGKVSEVVVLMKPAKPPAAPRGYAGLELEDQLQDIRVKAVTPGGPAARAGFLVGDILIRVGEEEVFDAGFTARELAWRAPGTTVTVTIERGEKPLLLELTIAAAP